MPNWCENSVYVSGNEKKLQEIYDSNFSFNFIHPEPDYTKVKVPYTYPEYSLGEEYVDPTKAWWDWRIQNWGTKWDIQEGELYASLCHYMGGGITLQATFETAWNPPLGIYEKLEEQGFQVCGYYYEPMMDFMGIYEKGEDKEYSVPERSDSEKWEIPEYKRLATKFVIIGEQDRYEKNI